MRTAVYFAVVTQMVYAGSAQAKGKDFEATFDDCAEFVGIGHVPVANARDLVPSPYDLAGDDDNALLVVRIASCAEVTVDGSEPGPARVAQIGVQLAGSASYDVIDNYLLWFVTDSGKLHGKVQAAGVKNGNDQQLAFMLGAGDQLTIQVDAPNFPAFPLFGGVGAPGGPPQSFLANWYADGNAGTLLMQTHFQALRFGGTDLDLTPSPGSQLAELIGSASLTFDVLNSYNEWESASMQATLE